MSSIKTILDKKININKNILAKILKLHKKYLSLSADKSDLLKIINEVELPEGVYNSNAIENSTLTLEDTERILLDLEISKDKSLREINEAQNLGKVMGYVEKKCLEKEVDIETINFLHKILLNNIKDDVAGRTRNPNEWVRIGKSLGADPKEVLMLLAELLNYYRSSEDPILIKTAKFHLAFEKIHPFVDGNGRMGRVLINYMLLRNNFPPIIIKNKFKQDYYKVFREENGERKLLRIICVLICEALNKRLAYMDGKRIIKLDEYIKSKKYNKKNETASSLFNKAKRQTIPAFTEKGVWKIGV